MKKLSIILMFLLSGIFVCPESSGYDPFESPLPRPKQEGGEGRIVSSTEADLPLPSLDIQGIMWGGDSPQVIVKGEVYGIGDSLGDFDAKVFRIEKDTVFISYGKRIYKIDTKKGEVE